MSKAGSHSLNYPRYQPYRAASASKPPPPPPDPEKEARRKEDNRRRRELGQLKQAAVFRGKTISPQANQLHTQIHTRAHILHKHQNELWMATSRVDRSYRCVTEQVDNFPDPHRAPKIVYSPMRDVRYLGRVAVRACIMRPVLRRRRG